VQTHSNGRYVILRAVLETGDEFVRIKERYEDGMQYLEVEIDRKKIMTMGGTRLRILS